MEVNAKKLGKLKFLARKICGTLDRSNEEFVSQSKIVIRSFMKKFENIDNASDEEMLDYLNKNRAYLFCSLPFDRGLVHYMVYSVKKNAISKLFTWFLNDLTGDMDQLHPNINVIVGLSPTRQPETFLDYMQRNSNDPRQSGDFRDGINTKISEFKSMYKAKYFHELSEAEQAKLLEVWVAAGVKDEVDIPEGYSTK